MPEEIGKCSECKQKIFVIYYVKPGGSLMCNSCVQKLIDKTFKKKKKKGEEKS